jgi:hypothetical protein
MEESMIGRDSTTGEVVNEYGLGLMGVSTGSFSNSLGLAAREARLEQERKRLIVPPRPRQKPPEIPAFEPEKKSSGDGEIILTVVVAVLFSAAILHWIF